MSKNEASLDLNFNQEIDIDHRINNRININLDKMLENTMEMDNN